MAASSGDSSASAATACLHVAIGDWQEFLEEARRALSVLEKLDQEPDEPEKRSDSGLGASSTAPTPDDLTVENLTIDDKSSDKKKKKKKKKAKKSNASGHDESCEDDDASTEAQSTIQSSVTASNFTTATPSVLSGDAESARLAEADQLAAKGTQLARSGEPEQLKRAIQLLGSAIGLYPARAGYYGNRSLCFFKSGDYASSLQDAEAALRIEPTNLKYLNRKAQALIKLKRQSDAQFVAEEMLQLSPQNETAQAIIEEIRRQLTEEISANRKHDDDEDDDDTISCAPSSVQFPLSRPVAVKVSNLPPDFKQEALKSVFTSAGVAIAKIEFSAPGTAQVYVLNADSAISAVKKLDGYVYDQQKLKLEVQK